MYLLFYAYELFVSVPLSITASYFATLSNKLLYYQRSSYVTEVEPCYLNTSSLSLRLQHLPRSVWFVY